MSLKDNIWIYSDLTGRFAELASGAIRLGGKAQALVIGSSADAEIVAQTVVAKVHAFSVDTSQLPERYLDDMAKTIRGSAAPALVLVASTRRGRLLGASLAAMLGVAVVSDVNSISLDGDSLTVTRNVYGGLAQGSEKINSSGAVLLVSPGVFDLVESPAPAEIIKVDATASGAVKRLGRHPKQSGNVELGRARRVVAAGRGVKSQGDLAMIEALAKVLEAEVGCSRPLAEGENWLEHERYIGITGIKLKADLYLGLGVSGQIQHMAGVNSSRLIVAVNKDKNAPIFQYADYGLVGDIYKVVPTLTELLR